MIDLGELAGGTHQVDLLKICILKSIDTPLGSQNSTRHRHIQSMVCLLFSHETGIGGCCIAKGLCDHSLGRCLSGEAHSETRSLMCAWMKIGPEGHELFSRGDCHVLLSHIASLSRFGVWLLDRYGTDGRMDGCV